MHKIVILHISHAKYLHKNPVKQALGFHKSQFRNYYLGMQNKICVCTISNFH